MTDTIERTGPKQAKRDKYFALLGIGKLTDKQLAEAQKLARTIVQADVRQDKADAKVEAKDEKARILYEARLEKCRLARAELAEFLPVTQKEVDAFDAALVSGKFMATHGEYAKATAELDKVSATHAPGKGLKAWNDAATAAEKLAPEAFKALAAIDQMLAGPELRLTRSAVASILKQKFDLGRSLLAPNPARSVLASATQSLQTLRDSVRTDIATGKAEWERTEHLRAKISRELNMIAPLSGDLVPLLSDREAAPLRLRLASADTSMSVGDFPEARAVLAALADEIALCQKVAGPLRDEWIQRQPELRPLADEAKQFAAEAQAPAVSKDALALSNSLQNLLAQGPGRALELGEAIDLIIGGAQTLAGLRRLESEWLLFQGKASGPARPDAKGDAVKTLDAAKQSIESRFKDIEEALKKLHEGVAKIPGGGDPSVADAAWVARRDAARVEWTERVGLARDVETLDEAGMQAKLVALRKDINATRRNPVALQAAVQTGQVERARQEYSDARQIADQACDALLAIDAGTGAQHLLAIRKICAPVQPAALTVTSDAKSIAAALLAYGTATQGLKAQTQAVSRLQVASKLGVSTAQAALKQTLDAVAVRLEVIKDLANSARTGAKQGPLAALLDTLQASLDGMRAMGGLQQLNLLQETIREAEGFAQEVEDSISAAKGKNTDDMMSFDKARRTIANLNKELDSATSRLYCSDTHDVLTSEVKAVADGLGTMTMAEMTSKLGGLVDRVQQMKVDARQAKQDTEAFEKTTVAALLKTLKDKAYDAAPEYRKTMKAKIEGLVATHRFEGGQGVARTEAQTLAADLKAILTGGVDERGIPQLLANAQADELTKQNEKIVEQGKWEGESKVVGKQLEAMKALNPREVQPLLDLLDSARTTVKKNGDHGSGREQLMAIRKRMSLIAANPQGLAITARNKLPQVNARVKKAINAYMDALNLVNSKVQALPVSDVDAAGKQAVADQLDGLRGLFNPAVFDEVVAKMSAKSNSREQRSGEREKGLREVRRMQNYLSNDIRLRTLGSSPYHDAMPSVLSALMLALLDIENNMLVSI